MANTILLKGRGHRVEAPAAAEIMPGQLVTRTTTGYLTPFNTAGGAAPRIFAVENDIIGDEITDPYAENDYVQAEHLYSGCEALGFLIANAAAVVIGDLLEAGGAGGFRKLASGVAIAQALEAVDNSANATQARIKLALL